MQLIRLIARANMILLATESRVESLWTFQSKKKVQNSKRHYRVSVRRHFCRKTISLLSLRDISLVDLSCFSFPLWLSQRHRGTDKTSCFLRPVSLADSCPPPTQTSGRLMICLQMRNSVEIWRCWKEPSAHLPAKREEVINSFFFLYRDAYWAAFGGGSNNIVLQGRILKGELPDFCVIR